MHANQVVHAHVRACGAAHCPLLTVWQVEVVVIGPACSKVHEAIDESGSTSRRAVQLEVHDRGGEHSDVSASAPSMGPYGCDFSFFGVHRTSRFLAHRGQWVRVTFTSLDRTVSELQLGACCAYSVISIGDLTAARVPCSVCLPCSAFVCSLCAVATNAHMVVYAVDSGDGDGGDIAHSIRFVSAAVAKR